MICAQENHDFIENFKKHSFSGFVRAHFYVLNDVDRAEKHKQLDLWTLPIIQESWDCHKKYFSQQCHRKVVNRRHISG